MHKLLIQQVHDVLHCSPTDLPADIIQLLQAINTSYLHFQQTIDGCSRQLAAIQAEVQANNGGAIKNEGHVSVAQRITHTGSWQLDLTNLDNINSNALQWSDETFYILGCTPGQDEVTNDLFFSRVHPHDRALVGAAVNRAIATGENYDVEHRVVLPDGTQKIVHEQSEIIYSNGKMVSMVGSIQDITAVRAVTNELARRNHELHTLFENMQEGFFSVDAETQQMLQMSKASEEIWGHPVEDFYKNPNLWFDLVLDEDRHIIEANYPLMLAGKAFKQQYRIRHGNGSVRWLESKIMPTLNSAGKLIRIDGMTSDITDKKVVEKNIRESEERYRVLFEQNLAGIYRTTTGGTIINCNEAFAAMLGYTSIAELLTINAKDLYFLPENREAFVTKVRSQKKLSDYGIVLKCRDGSPLYVVENVTYTQDAITGEEYCDGVMVNITEHKNAEAKLYKSEQRYRQIVETAQEGIWTIDEYEKTNFVNKKICEILEYSPGEMMGKELYDFMDEEGKAYAIECMERRRNGAKENLDIRYVTKSGRMVWANIAANPIFDDNGVYRGALAMVTDVTERRNIAVERERLISDLVQRNKDLQQFNYIISHNLRAPVANIMGLVNLFSDQNVHSDNNNPLLKGLSSAARSLDTIIRDLNYILQVREKINEKKEKVYFTQLVQEITAGIDNIITEQHVILRCYFEEAPFILTIRGYMYSIFYNLILNSIKYRQHGKRPVITVKSKQVNGHIELVFEDNGKGIDIKRHKDSLFGLYKRFDSSVEGKGLGLFMVKTQVENLGGNIIVESEVHKGARFVLLFPSQ